MKSIECYWKRLMLHCGNPKEGTAVFAEILQCYGETWRSYHTLEHIRSMLAIFDEYREECGEEPCDLAALLFAIWLHDLVYDPKRNDNEEQCAIHAHQLVRLLGFDEEFACRVDKQILATKQHRPTDDSDTNILLGLDLAILGAPRELFNCYCEGIRLEYGFMAEADYRAERIVVLDKLAQHKPLFAHPWFHRKFDVAARCNMFAAIAQLR